MPLLKRQSFDLVKPPIDLDDNEEVFMVRYTGEIFRDYEEYIARVEKYRERIWTCKVTGKTGLTYEEALLSEKKAFKENAENFPNYKTTFLGGEEVEVPSIGKNATGKIISIINDVYEVEWKKSLPDKENTKHKVKDLVKKKLSKSVVKQKIREIADKERYKGAPWMIQDKKLIEKFHLATKLPSEIQELKDAWDKKNKKVNALENESNESSGQNKKRRTEDASKPKPIKYPIADELLDHDTTKEKPLPSTDFSISTELLSDYFMVWSFLSTFGKLLNLYPFSLEDFEGALTYEYETELINETIISMLKICHKPSANENNWHDQLIDFLSDEVEEFEALIEQPSLVDTLKETNFYDLPLENKLTLLRYLVECSLETDEIRAQLDENLDSTIEIEKEKREAEQEEKRKEREEKEKDKSKDKDTDNNGTNDNKLKKYDDEIEKHQVRNRPLGVDRNNNRYWCFEKRLYIEMPSEESNSSWGYYSTKDELDSLLEFLDPRGIREFALLKNLKRFYNSLINNINKRIEDLLHSQTEIRRSSRIKQVSDKKEKEKSFQTYTNKWSKNK